MIGIIIQARMGSKRLPGKVLRNFEGKSLLEHIVDRLGMMKQNSPIVIATTDLLSDNSVEEFCKRKNVTCFRGSENNVLKRYYDCATMHSFTDVVRMTADNPFPDIEELDKLIEYHEMNLMDFTENFSVLPVGVGMEIISYKALKESLEYASLPKHFEHADEYILDNIQKFRHDTLEVNQDKNRPEIRLTVDTVEDYKKACYIIKNSNMEYVTTQKAIELSQEYEKNR